MKCAFKGVNFWIEQKDVEVQLSVNKAGQFRQQCEQMQAVYNQKMGQVEEAYSTKLQQVQAAYQKAMKKIQGIEQEKEAIVKDKKEIQEKYTEKSRCRAIPMLSFLSNVFPWMFILSFRGVARSMSFLSFSLAIMLII